MLPRTSEKIKSEWGFDVPVDKSSRRYDYVINTGKDIIIFETNFYGGGGSKLKATAGEYKSLHNFISSQNITFIWITDGKGWLTALSPYLRLYQKTNTSLVFNGYKWKMAHYLSPIAVQHFLITSKDGVDVTTSPIYQNPGWPVKADMGATN